MFRFLNIIWSSFKMALQEFQSNKLRTFLSLLGITFGIFCIISVLSTISSMEYAVQNDLKSLGNRTIFVGKFEFGGGPDYPWWKYIKRPSPKYEEMLKLKLKVPAAANIAFFTGTSGNMEYGDNILTNVNYYGITDEFNEIQPITIESGRYFQESDFDRGANIVVIGYGLAQKMFGAPQKAIGNWVKLKNDKPALVVGLIKKQGQSLINAWDYDNSLLMPHSFLKQIVRDENAGPTIMVQGGQNMSTEALKDELSGAMRSLRRLSPTQENNFSLNDVDTLTGFLTPIFSGMNVGGWAIAALSLIVGMFGVANIMFVTVKERTSQIGLKKAIGAKRSTILSEFLLESAFLCIIGGAIGLLAVFILTLIFSTLFAFKVFIPAPIIAMAVGICLVVGVLAGIIPAITAARLDPVVAIRSN
jgi:putative ABC transport system permease protein